MNLTLRTLRSTWLAAALAAGAVTLGAPQEASACGGFFCSASPIDQTAEHILFSVNADHTVTAYVQIRYSGDRDGFAWIVPAPGVPTLSADFPDQALSALDSATQPRYSKSSCNGPRFDLAVPGASAGSAAAPPPSQGVTVLAHQIVGPFDTVTLAGTSADVLVKWLKDHQYRFNDSMIPLLQPYVEAGMHFVAARLTADKTATDIKPLVMTYTGDRPMIPLRLTSVAAQPEMGIVTWILSDQRWAPENFQDLKIPDKLIQFDQYGGQNNYLTLVSSESDKVGGEAFVTEYAKSTTDIVQQIQAQGTPSTPTGQTAQTALLSVLQKFPYITRLYARMSAEDMRDDPRFMPASDQTDVSNIHDLTDPNFDYSKCPPQPPPPPDPCTFTYCGRRGVCVPTLASAMSTGGQATVACACATDATARATTTGGLQPVPYCEPMAMNLDAAGAGAQAALLTTACDGFACGAHGKCAPMNGNPTCQCESGYGAVATPTYDPVTGALSKTTMTCEAVGTKIPTLPVLPPVGQARMPTGSGEQGGCSVDRAAPTRTESVWLLAIAGLAFGLRRRRMDRAS